MVEGSQASPYDVVIVGGGVIGSAVAFFLAEDDGFKGSVLVVERDPTYRDGSTARSVGGIRTQFSTPENIAVSRFGADFFRSVPERLATASSVPDVSFRENGYLYLATERGLAVLEENHAVQREHGAEVVLLDPDELRRRFPWLRVDDLAAGSLGLADEGWIDPYSLLMAFRAKALELGATYTAGEVVAIERRGDAIDAVVLADGRRVETATVVNAAGPRAAEVAAMAGLELEVRPRKRFVFTLESRLELPDAPLVIDPGGVYFRPEGGRFVCGTSPPPERDPDTLGLCADRDFFEELVWPSLAHRVPAFEELKVVSSWAGHYAVNVRDRNAVLGPHPECPGFYFANGFSGHGLQQAPAVGRAIAELIAHGSYRSLDLRRFSYERFAAGRLIHERNVI